MDYYDIPIANEIHYPRCWDTTAYPTLATALWHLLGGGEFVCPTCGERFACVGRGGE